VTVYDRHDRGGGLLIYGIPGFKLEKDVVERRTQRLDRRRREVQAELRCRQGRSRWRAARQARCVLIATGRLQGARSRCRAGRSNGVLKALDLSDRLQPQVGLGDDVPEFDERRAQRRRQARRRHRRRRHGDGLRAHGRAPGREIVTCLYRRDRANMPGSQREVPNAEEEGVVFEWLAAPKSSVRRGQEAGVAPAACARRAGRERAPIAGRRPGSEFDLPGDLMIAGARASILRTCRRVRIPAGGENHAGAR
jgi:glutamate synthase (NADPH/NADH) small chain